MFNAMQETVNETKEDMFGIVLLLVLDSLILHLHLKSDKPKGVKSKLNKTTMMVLAVTLHNILEGMVHFQKLLKQ